jgi:ribose transport system substrate-binding protein
VAGCIAASGCGGSDSGSAGDAGGDSPHVGKRLAIVEALTGDGFYTQVSCGAIEAGRALGFKVDRPQGPKAFDPAQQVAVTNGVLLRDPDALVYMPLDPKTALPPVKPAVADGMKIATVDTTLADPSVVTSFVSSDLPTGAEMAAQEIIRQLGGKGKVLAEGIVPDHPITKGRIERFEAVIKSAPGIEYLGAHYPQVDISKIAADVAAALRKDPDIRAIYTTQSTSAQGAVTALREAGLEGKVKVVSWDADSYSTKALEAGQLSALIAQRPREAGRVAVQQLANAFDGKPVQKVVHPGLTIINGDNISDPETRKLFYTKVCG